MEQIKEYIKRKIKKQVMNLPNKKPIGPYNIKKANS